jgi:hypothetical protein
MYKIIWVSYPVYILHKYMLKGNFKSVFGRLGGRRKGEEDEKLIT